jgi:rRNA-processing protein FCF1
VARTYLIDAHNALHRLFEAPPESADVARKAIVERARTALARRGEARAHLVFDTTPAGRVRAGTHGRDGAVSWSYANGSADEEILRLVRENDAKDGDRLIAVVTDDRELKGRCAQLGAATLHVRDWFQAKDVEAERTEGRAGPPHTAADFGFTSDVIDLDSIDPDDL